MIDISLRQTAEAKQRYYQKVTESGTDCTFLILVANWRERERERERMYEQG